MKLNEKIMELRKKVGLSQEELGNKINVSRQAISKWELEQTKPDIDNIKELSKVFNVSIEYLLNDEWNEDILITDKDNKKINLKKLMLKILLIFLIIYFIIFLYKFVVIIIYSNKSKKVSDYTEYAIHSSFDLINMDERISGVEHEYYNGNEYLSATLMYDSEQKDIYTSDIQYSNKNNNKAFKLSYDDIEDGYIYEENEILEPLNTIRGLAEASVPTELPYIILSALSPNVKIRFNDDYFIIETTQNDVFVQNKINKITGLAAEFYSCSEYNTTARVHYVYDFENITIEEPNLNEYNLIK